MNELTIQGNGKTSEASLRRKINIDFITNLSLQGLSYEKNERMLQLYVTSVGEKLFLQYPGKESKRDKNPRERDFRPKIILPNNQVKDLSFGDVWDFFFNLLKKNSIQDKDFLKALDYLIVLFYKSAYLIDFKLFSSPQFLTSEVLEGKITDTKMVSYYSPVLLYDVEIHRKMINYVQQKFGNVYGMSIEAFVLYNDILGWNEDYKYYSSWVQKGKKWAGAIGKPNNLLTHINILGYIRNEFNIGQILNGFSRTRGVSAPTNKNLTVLFEKYINPEIKKL